MPAPGVGFNPPAAEPVAPQYVAKEASDAPLDVPPDCVSGVEVGEVTALPKVPTVPAVPKLPHMHAKEPIVPNEPLQLNAAP